MYRNILANFSIKSFKLDVVVFTMFGSKLETVKNETLTLMLVQIFKKIKN